jgi:hypothetical protein
MKLSPDAQQIAQAYDGFIDLPLLQQHVTFTLSTEDF